ncbi:MAG: nonstructural protein [Microvirus sp.]|nr:MAG: nonstructural protein [Microvirus sp.]
MRVIVYSVFDSKTKAFTRPFMMANNETALRMFDDVVNDNEHPISKHPEDYTLYRIAEYDDLTAEYINTIPPEFISIGSSLKKAVKTDLKIEIPEGQVK